MSPQQYPNINGGKGLPFFVPSPPNQLSLSYPGERNDLPEMGYHHFPKISSLSEVEEDKLGQVKACVRGHWRPHEDAKLKELLALHGLQNWNLIAQKLEDLARVVD